MILVQLVDRVDDAVALVSQQRMRPTRGSGTRVPQGELHPVLALAFFGDRSCERPKFDSNKTSDFSIPQVTDAFVS